MDAIAISGIASAVVSLLVPFLKNLTEGMSKKAGEEIGSKASNLAWEKTRKLHELIKAKFSSTPEASKAITALEQTPEDGDTQAVVRFQLKDMLTSDNGFAKELSILLKEASDAGANTVFQTTITGNVQNVIQAHDIHGGIKINQEK